MTASILLPAELLTLLYRRIPRHNPISYPVSRRASIKDVLESLGLPHPEIGAILINGRPAAFAHRLTAGDQVEVAPLAAPVNVETPDLLRPALTRIRFAVDLNVGKLAALLRLAGFDTLYNPRMNDAELAETSSDRVLLTRDRTLLMRRVVQHGHLIRYAHPEAQLAEVIKLYGLADRLRPFSRCLTCNNVLEPVAKAEILSRLQPLTKKYYDTFNRCRGCAQIYWPGSHRERMTAVLDRLRTACRQG